MVTNLWRFDTSSLFSRGKINIDLYCTRHYQAAAAHTVIGTFYLEIAFVHRCITCLDTGEGDIYRFGDIFNGQIKCAGKIIAAIMLKRNGFDGDGWVFYRVKITVAF